MSNLFVSDARMMMANQQFPEGFVWGAAAAAAQIEGAARAGGKGPSIWDRFATLPGKIKNGDTPEIACDHYHRYLVDFELLNQLGIAHYRLSIAWPRVFPMGDGEINARGLDDYSRMIDALLERGITPWVTLFHWDLPQALEDRGGWLARSTVEAFDCYAQEVVKRLGDRVKNWFTVNEIPCFIGNGYGNGYFAPGRRVSARELNQAYHHALLAHGFGVEAVRTHAMQPETRGSGAQPPARAADSGDRDRGRRCCCTRRVRADQRATDGPSISRGISGIVPSRGWRRCTAGRAGRHGTHRAADGFSGAKRLRGEFVCGGGWRGGGLAVSEGISGGGAYGWLKITPQSIYWAVRLAAEVFGVKTFYMTESGATFDDEVTSNGEVLDLHRREYLRSYLVELNRAIAEGYDVRGYFVWSLLDNFEWAEGNEKRFGIVHVDFATQRRTPKLSGRWYSEVIRANRIV